MRTVSLAVMRLSPLFVELGLWCNVHHCFPNWYVFWANIKTTLVRSRLVSAGKPSFSKHKKLTQCWIIVHPPWKWNEMNGVLGHLERTYRLNWTRRTSRGWWDKWDGTALQKQDSKFEPWRSDAEHATYRSRRLTTILDLYEWAGKKHLFLSNRRDSANTRGWPKVGLLFIHRKNEMKWVGF